MKVHSFKNHEFLSWKWKKMHKVKKWFQKVNLYINNHGCPLSTQHVNELSNNENEWATRVVITSVFLLYNKIVKIKLKERIFNRKNLYYNLYGPIILFPNKYKKSIQINNFFN